jgi:hypothetical protein
MTSTIVERILAPGYVAAEVLKANGVDVVFGLNRDPRPGPLLSAVGVAKRGWRRV